VLEAKTYLGLVNLPDEYSEIFAEASQESFFLSLPWFRNLETTVLPPGLGAEIITVNSSESAKSPAGALLLNRNPKNRLLSPVRLESLSNYYTSYFGVILRRDPNGMSDVVRCLVRTLCCRKPSWDVLDIRPVDLSKPAIQKFLVALKDVGIVTQEYFCFGNWYLKVAGRCFSEYFRELPSRVRVNVPRHKRRLQKAARVRIEVYRGGDQLDVAIRDYEAIYNSSWRDSEAYPSFIRGLILTAAQHDWLRLGILYVDDEPAAAQIWITHAGVASIYKLCYAEKFEKWSVGSILTAHLLEIALDGEKVHEVDYLTGDDTYKAEWMSDRRERWGIMAFNPKTAWGRAGMVRHIGGRRLKRDWNVLVKYIGGVVR
jgi:hypothetical protein